MTDRGILLGLDFGGTKLAACVVDIDGFALSSHRTAGTPRPGGPEQTLPVIRELVAGLLDGEDRPVLATGCSFGGPVPHPARGAVKSSMHLPGWEAFPLRDWLEDTFGAPAVIENDANAAAVGESRHGAGRGHQSLLYVTVSTGIGSGIIVDGVLHRGRDGLAGELGHVKIGRDGPVCRCGRRGCLETFAAGPAIARRAREAALAQAAEGDAEATLGRFDADGLAAEHVSRAADLGDPVAAEVMLACATDLGRGIADAVNLINPDLVVIGGGVLKSGDRYLAAVRSSVETNVFPGITVEVRRAELGDVSPLIGAVTLAQDALSRGD